VVTAHAWLPEIEIALCASEFTGADSEGSARSPPGDTPIAAAMARHTTEVRRKRVFTVMFLISLSNSETQSSH
jgi:hypothetical protein